jgi:hypothetical protein
MYVERYIEGRSRKLCCGGKAISITYSECVSVASFVQHAKRMRRIILSSVACPAVQHSPTLSHKRYNFRKEVTDRKIYFESLHKFCLKHFSF